MKNEHKRCVDLHVKLFTINFIGAMTIADSPTINLLINRLWSLRKAFITK